MTILPTSPAGCPDRPGGVAEKPHEAHAPPVDVDLADLANRLEAQNRHAAAALDREARHQAMASRSTERGVHASDKARALRHGIIMAVLRAGQVDPAAISDHAWHGGTAPLATMRQDGRLFVVAAVPNEDAPGPDETLEDVARRCTLTILPATGTGDSPAPPPAPGVDVSPRHADRFQDAAVKASLNFFLAIRPAFDEAVAEFNRIGSCRGAVPDDGPGSTWIGVDLLGRLRELAERAAALAVVVADRQTPLPSPSARPEDWPRRAVVHAGHMVLVGPAPVHDVPYHLVVEAIPIRHVVDLDAGRT